MPDLEQVAVRLGEILDPYRDRLVPGSVYGMVTLARAGSKAHGFFAAVRVAEGHVAFHLMPIYHDPSLLDGLSPALRRHLKGKSTFNFSAVDEVLFAELAALVARSYEAYVAAG